MPKATKRIPLTPDTFEEIRSLKRGGETYDSLLEKMARDYEPDESNG